MTKLEELEKMYRILLGKGLVKNKTELAKEVGLTTHTIHMAFSQGEPYVNDKLLGKIRARFGDELAEEPAVGAPVVLSAETFKLMQETIASQQRTIERLVSGPLVGERVAPKKINGDRDND